MIAEKKVVKFRCELYCILLYRDDYTGADSLMVRKVRDSYRGEKCSPYVKTPEGRISVSDAVMEYESDKEDYERLKRWYKETH